MFVFYIVVHRNTPITDGGDNITQLVLVYMLFLIPYGKEFKPQSLRVWFHNLGVIAIGLQVMIMYFTAGFMKIMGDVWTGGIALFNISQADSFSLPIWREILKDPYITTIGTYATIIFLIWFPIAMFSRVKLLWLGLGVLFHIGIIGFMGILTFGVVMIGMELFFITDNEYKRLSEAVKIFTARTKLAYTNLKEGLYGKYKKTG